VSLPRRKGAADLRSHRRFGREDLRTFGHRSRAKQLGYAAEDFLGEPVIAILNTWSDANTCHSHFRTRAEEVKRGVWQAGGYARHVTQADTGCDFDFLQGTARVPEPEIH
jgi:dihydroxyacid dehydratase/phosphogluconate dehydratase